MDAMTVLEQEFSQNGVVAWGVCGFDTLCDRLLDCRAAARLPQDARSVIVALFPYRFLEDGAPRNLSRYASVNDYHVAAADVMGSVAAAMRSAFPSAQFEVFCDNSPIPEVYAAAGAGLGAVGDNGLLLHPTFGSYVFICEMVTDMELPITGGEVAGCAHCGRCAAACPAGCVGDVDKATRCLSALTQKKGDLTEAERQLIQAGGLCWGCDRCQEVCPANQNAEIAPHPCFTEYAPWLDAAAVERPDLREKPYGWRGAAVLKRNLEIFK